MSNTLATLAKLIQGQYYHAPGDSLVSGITSLYHARPNQVAVYSSETHAAYLASLPDTAIILCAKKLALSQPQLVSPVYPVRQSMAMLIPAFAYTLPELPSIIHPTAKVHATATYDTGVIIDSYTTIASHVSIGKYCAIGKHCRIDSGVVLYDNTRIGDYTHVRANSVIGAPGFGYTTNKAGHHAAIHHQAGVWIGNAVSIGALTTIDRGVLHDTRIGSGTKIDANCHIAHNCIIGNHCLIAGASQLSGSVSIGDHTILAGDVSIKDGITIGNNCILLARSGVTKSWPDNMTLSGYPAQPHRQELKFQAKLRRLHTL